METDELIKLVDGIYKNILEKFNPGARQMINAGKAYLKALHGAAAASRLYIDAINKLAKQAQQGTWGGCSDVGVSLMKIVEVYKEIQDQQMNILKAFYVDLLVPLETNLEKDTKVVQSEQKRFLQQHKQRAETYSKAAAMMKKQRKKSRSNTKTGLAMDKELKNMQVLEEEKTKLDAFCEQSLKNAMTQERRRYGFVLERHCSLAKHYLSYHTQGVNSNQQNIDKWIEVAKTREYLPESVENIFTNKMRQISLWQDEDLYSNPRSPHFDDDRMSINSQLRKTKSMDASCLDIRSVAEVGSPVTTMSRAKSEYNLNTSTHSLEEEETPTRRPKSTTTPQTVPPPPQWDTQLTRALYAYLSSGENQLSFLEGDLIALIGERNKGWQFGENLRTQTSGWFPLAYTEVLDDNNFSPSHSGSSGGHSNTLTQSGSVMSPASGVGSNSPVGNNTLESPPPSGGARMFGDTLHLHRSSTNAKQMRRAMGSNPIPPPALPAPVPNPTIPYAVPHKPSITQSQSQNQFPTTKPPSGIDNPATSNTSPYSQPSGIKTSTSSYNFTSSNANQSNGPYSTHPQPSRSDSHRPATITPLPLHMQQGKAGKISGGPVGNVSLHSSNDSGFSNDPPPQPEIDYSDDESIHGLQGTAGSKVNVRNGLKDRRPLSSDDNNNTRKLTPMRHSSSSGNLIDNRYYVSDDSGLDQRKLVKRTKSFWRFGKNSSDNEIMEGMSLWRHRDLVDVDEKKAVKRRVEHKMVEKRHPRDTSNDSEKTINANNQYDNNETKTKKTQTIEKPIRHRPSFTEKQKLSLLPRKESQIQNEHFEENYPKPMVRQSKRNDQFYDDGDDGLAMRTVNRKNILQQYTNDSTGPDTESESEITSEDPYDCIVVNDQTQKVRKNGEHISNVAAIGKKLEKLSKNTKYSPNKDVKQNQAQPQQNEVVIRNERNKIEKKVKQDDVIQYQEKRHSFKTFGIEAQNSENGEEELNNDRYYQQQQLRAKKSNELKNEKQRYYNNSQPNTTERKPRVVNNNNLDPEVEIRNHRRIASEPNKKKDKYNTNYEQRHRESTTADEYSDVTDGTRQYLLRGKISVDSKYETDDTSLMDYGATIQRRLKSNDYGTKMEDKSPHSGNMYGPWYDLWGLDASVRK